MGIQTMSEENTIILENATVDTSFDENLSIKGVQYVSYPRGISITCTVQLTPEIQELLQGYAGHAANPGFLR